MTEPVAPETKALSRQVNVRLDQEDYDVLAAATFLGGYRTVGAFIRKTILDPLITEQIEAQEKTSR